MRTTIVKKQIENEVNFERLIDFLKDFIFLIDDQVIQNTYQNCNKIFIDKSNAKLINKILGNATKFV